ncbi:MAG TPA: T9SS type A sorting domain-containing protein [bacterium]|jgi:hypothetical protein
MKALFQGLTVTALVACLVMAGLQTGAAQPCLFTYTEVDMGNLAACYPTQVNNPGHGLSGVAWLGPQITGEAQPRDSLAADSCSGNFPGLDPGTDGVAFFGIPWQPCSQVTIAVLVSSGPNYTAYHDCGGSLYLNGWQDGNLNGSFDDDVTCSASGSSEWIIQDAVVDPGLHIYTFPNPINIPLHGGPHWGVFRFRLSSHQMGRYGYGLNPQDPACPADSGTCALDSVGEVEDYWICGLMIGIELVSFEAVPADHAVNLSWTTASEIQNDHFEIMRDGTTIARVSGTHSDTLHSYSYIDGGVAIGDVYHYMLVAVDVNGGRVELDSASAGPLTVPSLAGGYLPRECFLAPNYPNPFNPATRISFSLPKAERVSLLVFDRMGRKVQTLADGQYMAGSHTLTFDGTALPSGLYFCSLTTSSGFRQTGKMVLLK